MVLYGIPNCDTVKKARKWLENKGIEYDFHDYKKKGITAEKLQEWIAENGWQVLINKQGSTWRQLDINIQASITDEKSAIELLLSKNSIIKRPIAETAKGIIVGFNETEYEENFAKQ